MNAHTKEEKPALSKKVLPEMLQDGHPRNQANQLYPRPGQNLQTPSPLPLAGSSTIPSQRKDEQPDFRGKERWAPASWAAPLQTWPFFLLPHLALEHLEQIFLSSPTPKTLEDKYHQPYAKSTASTWHRTRLPQSQHSDTWGMK